MRGVLRGVSGDILRAEASKEACEAEGDQEAHEARIRSRLADIAVNCVAPQLSARMSDKRRIMSEVDSRREALPPPALDGHMSVEQAIARRRSVREFRDQPLTCAQIGQCCWAAQGITEPTEGLRAAPSAGALYPIEIYVVTHDGVEHYEPQEHALRPQIEGDLRRTLQRASLNQRWVGSAAACFVIAAAIDRTARKYGDRAGRYCLLEAGHVAQNLHLQATALGLGSVAIGAFEDDDIARLLRLPRGQQVLYLVAIGVPAE
jgi:SagB-type dehydrogenase family enzyme